MITIKTTAKSLREYNKKQKAEGLTTAFCGFMDRGDGVKVRAYLDYIKDTDTGVGDYYSIFFDCPFADDGIEILERGGV